MLYWQWKYKLKNFIADYYFLRILLVFVSVICHSHILLRTVLKCISYSPDSFEMTMNAFLFIIHTYKFDVENFDIKQFALPLNVICVKEIVMDSAKFEC